ncbi:MAG: hypothetical protein HZC46_09395 [Ignavibacterium album]|jgi:hypothetical protein|uniref:hypothetical protein n=1 Tax=Ignavibacterium album TaxID=591197 RepID=UPI0026EEB3E1|nr:hypothetical protein [Ignavibacterium album]MBI5662348.1 hypothetical protein [Ignavibacterium album]
MLIPNKYENIDDNLLVLGAKVISLLKQKPYVIEDLFLQLNKEKGTKKGKLINLDQYFNALTFLWLADLILYENFIISINRNDTQTNLFNSR